MNKFTITTLVAGLLFAGQAKAYEPYGTDVSLQISGGVSMLNVFDANTLSRNAALSLNNYDIQFRAYPTKHLGLFARQSELSTGLDKTSVYTNNPMTFGALYRYEKGNWGFLAGGGLGFATAKDYSLISRGPAGVAPEMVHSANVAAKDLALVGQFEASYHILDVLYVFGNLSVFGYTGKNTVVTRYYDTDETWSGSVRYISGDIQSRDWQAKTCTDMVETTSRVGINPMLSLGIGFSFCK